MSSPSPDFSTSEGTFRAFGINPATPASKFEDNRPAQEKENMENAMGGFMGGKRRSRRSSKKRKASKKAKKSRRRKSSRKGRK